MKLSLLPGDLHLTTGPGGNYLVSSQGEVVCDSPSQRRAIAAFNKIRKNLEAKFRPRPLSDREKSDLYFKDKTGTLLSIIRQSEIPRREFEA